MPVDRARLSPAASSPAPSRDRPGSNAHALAWPRSKPTGASCASCRPDGRITNVELARRVGISAPPCLRRVRAGGAGLIGGYAALPLDDPALGYDVTAFAMVGLHSQAEADLTAFETARARLSHRARLLYAVRRDRLHAQMRGAGPHRVSGFHHRRAHRRAKRRQRQDLFSSFARRSTILACPSRSCRRPATTRAGGSVQ